MKLVLFDFDGTLTTKDSLGEFIKFVVGDFRYYAGLIKFSPVFIMWKLGIIKNYEAKEKLFALYFKNMSEDEFNDFAHEYSTKHLHKIQRQDAYEIFLKHIKDGDRVLIVSASMKSWLEPWCQKHEVELLSTELAFEDGKFNGNFATKNCHGIEKVNRINSHLNIEDYEIIHAYGDSSGDIEMLELADIKYYKGKKI